MKVWRCPKCKRVVKWEYDLVMKVCLCDFVAMEVVEDDKTSKRRRG